MDCSLAPTRPSEPATDSAHNGDYLDRLMRRECFEALWPLFAKAPRPAKELTESYSALVHLRPFLTGAPPHRVIHVGDGAHGRTGAMFSLKTRAHSISVDPGLNLPLIEKWRDRFGIRRFDCRKARIEDVIGDLNALPVMPTLVTFVHAHVAVDDVLAELRWDAAFTLACCHVHHQLSRTRRVYDSGADMKVLSVARNYQVLVND
jgi:hypothetical protein